MDIDTTYCKRKILDVHGAAGQQWLLRLPALVQACAGRWSLHVLPPFPIESYSYVAPATLPDLTPVVLKIAVPGREVLCQAEALRWWNGSGAVRLLDADLEQGILLMERVLPGDSLEKLSHEDQVTDIQGQVMRGLWKPAPPDHPFDTVEGWSQDLHKLRARFQGGYGPYPPRLVDRAAGLFADLLAGLEQPMLIHGDMNSGNLLRSHRAGWLVIDPKGVVGHPLYDVATYLNYLPEDRPLSDLLGILDRRVRILSDQLGYSRQEMLGWGQAHAVLAGYWTFEDHGTGWEWPFSVAELYDALS